ncbi:hypothetical protein TUM20985_34810 [Mycobacterium antarcticum]|nr:hypothetical protein TUM20985_34810 [Mycolicibacterium sp. TUM20985]GLP76112.1 hypothetical protein TUM20983_32220 [Mycolicibacterium sp. TUM20983]GLP83508.1 hypothetical protein TUM20984_49280 [Mycolicibacterium sp. TUM20984]
MQVCSESPPRKIAPTLGSGFTGAAVAVASTGASGTDEDGPLAVAASGVGCAHAVAIATHSKTLARRTITDLAARDRMRQRSRNGRCRQRVPPLHGAVREKSPKYGTLDVRRW